MNDDRIGSQIEELLGTDLDERALRTLRVRRAAIAGLLLLMLFVGVRLMDASDGEIASYRTQAVTRGDLTVSVTATGTIQPRNEVTVGIEVSGTIAEVFADHNDVVRAGDLLARLDTSILAASVARSRAALRLARAAEREAEVTLSQTRSELGRLMRLREEGRGSWTSEQELEAAQAAHDRAAALLESARAQVEQANASLSMERTQLAKAEVISPIGGVVLSRRVDPGQTVAASLQTPELFVLAEDLREMELSVEVDEADVGQIREGLVGRFTVDAFPDAEFPAEIAQVRYAPHTSAGVVTYEAILSVENGDLRLRPGMTATAVIVVEQVDDALLVPNAALRFVPKVAAPTVEERGLLGALLPRPPAASAPLPARVPRGEAGRLWVLDEEQTPRAIEVRVGATDGTWTAVQSSELEPGAPVIVEQRALP